MAASVIAIDDPRASDVRALLGQHLRFAHDTTPVEHIHALDLDGLLDPAVTVFGLRESGELLGIGAIKQLDADHVELKSMHTVAESRRRGIGRAMLDHLLAVAVAVERGAERVSLETGTMEAFAPARSLYASAGFEPCGPFGDCQRSPSNTFMTLVLGDQPGSHPPRA